MKLRKLASVLIFLFIISSAVLAIEYNLIAGEPLGLFNHTLSGYYSKISTQNRFKVTFPLKYQEQTDSKSLSAGIEYRKFLIYDAAGFYFETNGYIEVQDYQSKPDVFVLTPTFVIGYRVDTGQGVFVEPELVYTLPLISVGGSSLDISQNIDSTFNIVLGLDNVYPNGMFFAPRLQFSYHDGALEAFGKLYLGYGF